MLKIKQDLLAGLATALDALSPGAGAKAAFESPKVAAHGDFAITAAMQLAKPLKLNPRQLGEQLREALLALPVFQQWVADIDIAGPGFINIRLKPEAKQQVVREVLAAGPCFGEAPSNGQKLMVEFVSANPTGPLHVGHGRQAALGDAICNLYGTQGWQVHREFYYNDAGVQIGTLATSTQLRAKGLKPGDAGWPSGENAAAYNGDYIQDIANDFLAKKTVHADDREFTASGDLNDLDGMRQFAVAYLRHEQDLDLQAFAVKFDHYYLESSLYTSGRVEATVKRLVEAGKTYEQDGALWLKSTDYGDDKDRVMRKGDGTLHLLRARCGVPHRQVGARLHQGDQHPGHRPPRHHRARARRPAGGQRGYSGRLPRLRAAHHGARGQGRRRGEDQQARGQLRDPARPDRVDQQRRGALLPAQPQARHRVHLRRGPGGAEEQRQPGVLRAVRACAHLLGARGLGRRRCARCKTADLTPLDSPAAQALMLLLAKYPAMLTDAARDFAPHDVTFYLRELAASYHSYYDAERILVDDEAVKKARLALVSATAQVLHNGLAVLGVSAPQKM